MRTDPPVIDLGVIDLGAEPPVVRPDPPRPPGQNRREPVHLRLRRWWPLVSLTVLLVASTGAAAPVSPGLTLAYQVAAESRTAVALTAEDLYVATGTPAGVQVPEPEWQLRAYRLADGAPRWQVAHQGDGRHGAIAVSVADGLPLVTGWQTLTAQMSRPAVDIHAQTTAYDPDTGQVRWNHPGFVAATGPGQVVLDLVEYTGNPPEAVSYRVTGVDPATGRVNWDHRVLVGSAQGRPTDEVAGAWTLSADGRYLVTLSQRGRLAVRELATGTETVRLLGQSWHDASVVVVGDLVRVAMLKDRQRTFTVHDLPTLRTRWTLPDRSAATSLLPCGPVLCLRTPDRLQGLDAATGRPRWDTTAGWDYPTPLGPPWPPGWIQVRHGDAPAGALPPRAVAVAAGTGETRLDLGAWHGYTAGRVRHPYPVVELREPGAHRPGHPRYDPGRLWLGRVHPDQGRIEVLGALDHARGCEVGARHVACVSTRSRVEVWELY